MGQLIRVHLRAPVKGRLEYSGTIEAVKDDRVVVDTPQGLMELAIDNIQKAVQEI
jgi:ribosome maturation factor RimP